jgi:hypothetical protein
MELIRSILLQERRICRCRCQRDEDSAEDSGDHHEILAPLHDHDPTCGQTNSPPRQGKEMVNSRLITTFRGIVGVCGYFS